MNTKLVLLLCLNLIVAVLGVAMTLVAYRKTKRAKAAQDKFVRSLSKEESASWIRVRISRPDFFQKRLKLVGFESSGILVNLGDRIRVLTEFDNGALLDKTLSKESLNLQWVGNPGLSSSNMHWISLGQEQDRLMISADTGFNAVQSREATADICRRIDPHFRLPDAALVDFALEKNKASLSVLALMLAMMIYAFADGIVINDNELLQLGPLAWFMPVLALLFVPIYFGLVRSKVPSRESLVLSMLCTAAFTFALIPLAMRVDQYLAGAAKSYEYKLVGETRLVPLEAGVPDLNFHGAKEFWAQYDKNSLHRFELIHGPVGLWQLDRTELLPRMQAFYEKLESKK